MLNKTVVSQLQNPPTRDRDQRDRVRVLESFAVLRTDSGQLSLVLRRYLDSLPENFFDNVAYETYRHWLERQDQTRRKQLKEYLSQFDSEINRALLFLREINLEGWQDSRLTSGDDYELIRMIDKMVHPAYLRLVEGVLTPLLRPLAYFSRIDRGKGVDGLDVWSITGELRGSNEDYLIRHYEHIIRNGIAHGGISFLQREIRYRDQRGNQETFSASSVVRLFDDLLDTCNGLAVAMKVFFIVSLDRGYRPPGELMIEVLQEQTWAPWWAIEGCVEAEIAGRSQLTVYARPDTRDSRKVIWSTVQSGILSESLSPGYDRYFFSLRSRKALPGWAAFDGQKLRELREKGAESLSDYRGVLEGDVIFYVPRLALPTMFAALNTLATSVSIAIPTAMQKIRDGLESSRMFCRDATLHRNSWGAVVRGGIVIEGLDGPELVKVIRNNCGRIVRMGKRHARKEVGFCIATLLPIGYAQIAVFRRDYRHRRVSGFGLGKDLVCTVRLQRLRRISSPDIIGSTIETNGKWRIAWNREWLNDVGQHVLERSTSR